MRQMHNKMEGPVSVEEDSFVHGIITAGATVRSGVTLHLQGMIIGDLTVERGGKAILHGIVTGTVHNDGGHISIFGVVEDVIDLSTESQTVIHAGALIRKRRHDY